MLVASIKNHTATHPDPVDTPPAFGDGPHMNVGIFGTTWIFDVLAAYDQDAIAIQLLQQTTFPSLGTGHPTLGFCTLWLLRLLVARGRKAPH